ncbi:MAG: Periplasmic binding protein [Intestinibacter bartlettii DORA_8_9]|nr:MAG: Periplasmic binding protein [Intestinibacter bartlettii DORA_8_9]
MKKLKRIVSILLCACMLFCVGCSSTKSESSSKTENKDVKVEDLLGRSVDIQGDVESIICIGPGCLRMVSYMQCVDKVIGVEEEETDKSSITSACPYRVAYPELSEKPVIAQGNSGTPVLYNEEIIELDPDVIFTTCGEDVVKQLEEKTDKTVIALAYNGIFDDNMDKSLEIIGQVLNKEDRAEELIAYMNEKEKDLNDRTKDIKDENKPTVYTGGVSFKGPHGFDGTSANYAPFNAINAINVADKTNQKGAFLVDLEKVLEWNPDYIFLNPQNMNLVNEDYSKNKDYYESLDAVKDGNIYSQVSYNWYTTNVEIGIIDAYYAGTVIYPEQFSDVNIEDTANEITKFMLGKEMYDNFVDDGLSFDKITIGEKK